MVLAAFDKFATANDAAKYLALGVAAVTGILAIISQYAIVREGEALVVDLRRIENRAEVSNKIADSRGLRTHDHGVVNAALYPLSYSQTQAEGI